MADLEKVLAPFAEQRVKFAEALPRQVLAKLKSQGFIKARATLQLNDAGKERALVALRAFGMENLPSKVDWAWVKRWIVLQHLGLTMTPAALKRTGDSDWLTASVLCARLGIRIKGEPTLKRVGEALAWRALGGDEASAFNVDTAFGSALLRGLPSPIESQGVPSPDAPPRSDALATEDPGAFSARVMMAARNSPTGRWHGKKVFISHVWEELCRQGNAGADTFKTFQKRLVEAHRAQQVTLSRADLVEAMPPADVKASETAYLDSTFHFVRIDGG